jgi:protein arginine N-methyltransferase 2
MELYETIKMSGVYAEVLLNFVERSEDPAENEDTADNPDKEEQQQQQGEDKPDPPSDLHSRYLKSELEYNDSLGALLDDQGAPVMMEWESEIMLKTAEILLPSPGRGRVLNIGFGMGIVDGYFQDRRPESHVIVEAHPAVIKRMKETGWDKKPGVEVPPLHTCPHPPTCPHDPTFRIPTVHVLFFFVSVRYGTDNR